MNDETVTLGYADVVEALLAGAEDATGVADHLAQGWLDLLWDNVETRTRWTMVMA